ncbi:hypothetical protein Nekkels1_66 [Cellulophaga phage Nekkels_1]|uniref:Lipoprotein n=1 Tax=Cellulophaga phage Nekkels_1 TaxID=2745692 RepID=A0A8E4UXI5_9CAUD|nr:hypothetical protein M1M31_gp66 [Cellulophaga phage Nekkels_1]QQO97070.1 hypothetical protein Nekkels1_66 [Cellulophaga phage Nekkels_1]QQO97165.1 hypothetical protein Nekkels2_68 [Cellulophaga phage Nekkels_2]
MKKSILKVIKMLSVLSLFAIISSCGNGENSIKGEIEYRTIEVDGCEYITKYNGYQRGFMFTHKGNCKFCTYRNSNE